MEVDREIIDNNCVLVNDKNVSYRYILYQKETFYNTEKVIKRGSWCPSISMIRQAAEVMYFQNIFY